MGVQIKRYSVCTWGNKVSEDRYYGVRVLAVGHGWLHVTEGKKPVLLPTKKQALDYIAKMKAERDGNGFKKKAA